MYNFRILTFNPYSSLSFSKPFFFSCSTVLNCLQKLRLIVLKQRTQERMPYRAIVFFASRTAAEKSVQLFFPSLDTGRLNLELASETRPAKMRREGSMVGMERVVLDQEATVRDM